MGGKRSKFTKDTRRRWKKESPPWAEGIVYVVLFLVGLILLTNPGKHALDGWAAKSWPTAAGHVRKSSVSTEFARRARGRKNQTRHHKHNIEYSYTVDGYNYVNDQVTSAGGTSFKWLHDAEEQQRHYPVNASVTVFYHPRYPANSLLEPGVLLRTVIAALLAFPAMGAAMYFGYMRREKWLRWEGDNVSC